MIRSVLFGGRSWEEAKAGLDAGTLRQRTIAANLANAATPGYHAQEVAFEELLTSEQSHLALARSDPGHLAGTERPLPAPEVLPRDSAAGDASGVNDVSVEEEMTDMAENTIHYQALSQLLGNNYKSIQTAIGSSSAS